MKTILSGLFALAWLALIAPVAAQADAGVVNYKPGALKTALASNKAVLLHYKTSW